MNAPVSLDQWISVFGAFLTVNLESYPGVSINMDCISIYKPASSTISHRHRYKTRLSAVHLRGASDEKINLYGNNDDLDDNDFPIIDELLRCHLRREVLLVLYP